MTVCVSTSNGGVRLCVDFRATINPHVYVDPYPLPRFEDIIAKLSRSKMFSDIDLTDTYLQMEVDFLSRSWFLLHLRDISNIRDCCFMLQPSFRKQWTKF